MAIHISLDYAEIPVTIGDFSFNVSVDDDSLLEIDRVFSEVSNELKNMDPSDRDLEKSKEVLERAFDCILGDGAFEQLYSKTPSCIILAKVLKKLYLSIVNAFNDMKQDNGKKHKNRHNHV